MSQQPPPPPGQRQFYFCADTATVEGPVTADALLKLVQQQTLSRETMVCPIGQELWIPFNRLSDDEFSPQARHAMALERQAKVRETIDRINPPVETKTSIIIFGLLGLVIMFFWLWLRG